MYESDKWKLHFPNKETRFKELLPDDLALVVGEDASLDKDEIDSRWNDEIKRAEREGIKLIDGFYARFFDFTTTDYNLILKLGETSVKEFMSTNSYYAKHDEEKLKKIKQSQLSNPIGVISTVRTIDNYLPIPKRSSSVATYRNYYSLFGGAIGKNLVEPSGSSEELFSYTKQSLANELAIDPSLLHDMSLSGITQTKIGHGDFGDFMILFNTELEMTKENLEKHKEKIGMKGDFKKYDNVIFKSLDERIELQEFLNQNHYDIVGTGEPGLVLLGRHLFGEDFIDGLKRVYRI